MCSSINQHFKGGRGAEVVVYMPESQHKTRVSQRLLSKIVSFEKHRDKILGSNRIFKGSDQKEEIAMFYSLELF